MHWKKEEIEKLTVLYGSSTKKELIEMFPNRTILAIKNKAYKLSLYLNTSWKKEEIEKLTVLYGSSTKKELIEMFPCRTIEAIRIRASNLSLCLGTSWKKEEIEKLTVLYGSSTNKELIEMFPDRTIAAIQSKAYKLSLCLDTSWKKEEIETLLAVYPEGSYLGLMKYLPNRTWTAILVKSKKLKISRKSNIASIFELTFFNLFKALVDSSAISQKNYPGEKWVIDIYSPKYDIWVEHKGDFIHGKKFLINSKTINYALLREQKNYNCVDSMYKGIEKNLEKDIKKREIIGNKLISYWEAEFKEALYAGLERKFILDKFKDYLWDRNVLYSDPTVENFL